MRMCGREIEIEKEKKEKRFGNARVGKEERKKEILQENKGKKKKRTTE